MSHQFYLCGFTCSHPIKQPIIPIKPNLHDLICTNGCNYLVIIQIPRSYTSPLGICSHSPSTIFLLQLLQTEYMNPNKTHLYRNILLNQSSNLFSSRQASFLFIHYETRATQFQNNILRETFYKMYTYDVCSYPYMFQ